MVRSRSAEGAVVVPLAMGALLLLAGLLAGVHGNGTGSELPDGSASIGSAGPVPHAPGLETGSSVPIPTWHQGSDVSSSAVSLTYYLQFGDYTYTNDTSTEVLGDMIETMSFQYLDGTGVNVTFTVSSVFWPGGVDITSGTLPGSGSVLNWSDLAGVDVAIDTVAPGANGSVVQDSYSILGFDIINGSSLVLQNSSSPGGGFGYGVGNLVGYASLGAQVGSLTGGSPGVMIGPVSLGIRNASSQGGTIPQSVAQFNVSQPASIGGLNASDQVSVPASLSFLLTHNITRTEWKVGMNVNWSAAPDFPTQSPHRLGPGDPYSLVAAIDLTMGYSPPGPPAMTAVGEFTTDASNDSAFFSYKGIPLGTERTTTQFYQLRSPHAYNTTRTYVAHQSGTNGVYTSEIWVVLGGFTYGSSTGFSFDPAVITPDQVVSATSSTPPTHIPFWEVGAVAGGLVLLGVAVYAIYRLRRRRSPISANVSTLPPSKGSDPTEKAEPSPPRHD